MDRNGSVSDNQLVNHGQRSNHRGPVYIKRPVERPQPRISDFYQPKPVVKPKYEAPVVQPPPKPQPVAAVPDKEDHQPAKSSRSQKLLYAMAAVIFLIGLGVSLMGLRTNQKAQAQVNKISTSSQKNDNSDPIPSTKKPSDAEVRNYQAPVDLPRYIDIPALYVHSRVYALGVTKTGALATPNNIYNAGWYKQSSKPGEPGAMLVDGHSGLNIPGIFNGLAKLKPGDLINIKRGDGKVFTYGVVASKLYPADKVDMASLLVSANTAKPGLNLISCTGDQIPGTTELNQRLAVFAVLQ